MNGLARLAQRRHITLTQRVDSQMRVHMDDQDLQEMVGNLLDNALRWASQTVHVSFQAQQGVLRLTVSDDGPGMTAEECQAAVQRGKRLDEQRSGSGLGLAIVADLVALYGGQMRLQRAEAGGLQVVIELPVLAARA